MSGENDLKNRVVCYGVDAPELIPKFYNFIYENISHRKAKRLLNTYPMIPRSRGNPVWPSPDDPWWYTNGFVNDLWSDFVDFFNSISPNGYEFCVINEDCYGFWEV